MIEKMKKMPAWNRLGWSVAFVNVLVLLACWYMSFEPNPFTVLLFINSIFAAIGSVIWTVNGFVNDYEY